MIRRVVGVTPRVHVFAAAADEEAARVACLLGASRGEGVSAMLRARPELVLVRGDFAALQRGAWIATFAGARAVLALPVGVVAPLPWWGRRYQRFVFAAQPEALRWVEAGTSLGRVVVVEPEAEAFERAGWEAVVREVLSMGRRPAGGRAAR
jgi:hypothetical protein